MKWKWFVYLEKVNSMEILGGGASCSLPADHCIWTEVIIVANDDPVKSDSVGVLMVEEPVDTQAKES